MTNEFEKIRDRELLNFNDPKTQIKIKGNEMTLISDESNRLIYHRIVPDLQPAKLLPGQVSHGAPDL
jgi:hypothetical protein